MGEWEKEWWYRKVSDARSWSSEEDDEFSFRCAEFEDLLVSQ